MANGINKDDRGERIENKMRKGEREMKRELRNINERENREDCNCDNEDY